MAYADQKLPDIDERDVRDPFALFAVWFDLAKQTEINDPNAMALASVDADGLPDVRIVLLKGLDGVSVPNQGFVFYTNTTSTKGRELLAHPKAAIAFHWKSLRRQVRARGTVTLVSDAEADAYYATRPRGSQIGAWASDQSKPLSSRSVFEDQIAFQERRFGPGIIPRPPHWTGFRLTPLQIEFWQDRPFRLHDRIVAQRTSVGEPWETTRLYP